MLSRVASAATRAADEGAVRVSSARAVQTRGMPRTGCEREQSRRAARMAAAPEWQQRLRAARMAAAPERQQRLRAARMAAAPERQQRLRAVRAGAEQRRGAAHLHEARE